MQLGLTYVRELERLEYPIAKTLASFGALDGTVVVVDEKDPDIRGTEKALVSLATSKLWIVRCPWDFSGRLGGRAIRDVLFVGLKFAKAKGAKRILYLEADEAMLPNHVSELTIEKPDLAWLPRYTFWGDDRLIRLDWTVVLPRYASFEALQANLMAGEGDASHLPMKPSYAVQQRPEFPIFHYSRVGNPKLIADRRSAIARMWAPDQMLAIPAEYDFVPRRFENWIVGQQQPEVEGQFASYGGPYP